LPVFSCSSGRVAIIVCESMMREMRIVAVERKIPFVMRVLSSQCYRDPTSLKSKIDELVCPFLKDKMSVFVAYGRCALFTGNDHLDVYALKDLNCASILLGGDSEYQKLMAGAYFLTPHLALHWKEYFLGKKDNCPLDPKSAKRLEKWFDPIKKIVKIQLQSDTEDLENLSFCSKVL